jgi:hypothetical protein
MVMAWVISVPSGNGCQRGFGDEWWVSRRVGRQYILLQSKFRRMSLRLRAPLFWFSVNHDFEGDVKVNSNHIEFYLLIAWLKPENFYHGQLKP